jgi:hypothetical protein
MNFSTFLTRIASAQSEAALRFGFMEAAGQLVGAKAWGLDLLDDQLQVVNCQTVSAIATVKLDVILI